MQKLLLLLVLTISAPMAASANSSQEENLKGINAVNNNESGKNADVTQMGQGRTTDAEERELRARKRLNRQFRSKRPYINYKFN